MWLFVSGFLLLRSILIGKLMSLLTVVCMGICFWPLVIKPIFILPTALDCKTLAVSLKSLPRVHDTEVYYLNKIDGLAIHFYCDKKIFEDDNFKDFSMFKTGDFNVPELIACLKCSNYKRANDVVLEKIGLNANQLDDMPEDVLVEALNRTLEMPDLYRRLGVSVGLYKSILTQDEYHFLEIAQALNNSLGVDELRRLNASLLKANYPHEIWKNQHIEEITVKTLHLLKSDYPKARNCSFLSFNFHREPSDKNSRIERSFYFTYDTKKDDYEYASYMATKTRKWYLLQY